MLLRRTASPSLAVIAVTVKILIGPLTMIGKGDGKEVVWRRFYRQWNTDSDSAPQETPLSICRLTIGHCEVNRGQWPQVTLDDLETHVIQGQGSQLVMCWHQWHQLSPFKLKSCRRLFLFWRHNFVTWHDLTIFSPKVAQNTPHKLWKFQHHTPNGLASSSEKLMGVA